MSLAFDEYGRPFIILREQEKKKRVRGVEAVKANILAAKTVARTLRSSLGPKGMDKMLQSPDGDVTISERAWGAARSLALTCAAWLGAQLARAFCLAVLPAPPRPHCFAAALLHHCRTPAPPLSLSTRQRPTTTPNKPNRQPTTARRSSSRWRWRTRSASCSSSSPRARTTRSATARRASSCSRVRALLCARCVWWLWCSGALSAAREAQARAILQA